MNDWSPSAIAVCVPVKNERALLPLLLEALARQRLSPAGQLTVCLYFDGCSDGSERLTSELAPSLPFALLAKADAADRTPNAGRARRQAMALGLEATHGSDHAVLLTTDADTSPAENWLRTCCAALVRSDVVSGRVVRDQALPNLLQDRVERYFDRLYDFRRRLDPVPWQPRPAHHYTAGASLGFRRSAYLALGGFEPRAAAEDAMIVDAAHRAGLRVRHDPRVTVTTSSRRAGRVHQGLADHLRSMDGDAALDATRVGHPDDAAWQYRGQALARATFANGLSTDEVARLAARIGRGAEEVRCIADGSPNAEAFAMRVVPTAPRGDRLVPLEEAECVLASLEEDRHEPNP